VFKVKIILTFPFQVKHVALGHSKLDELLLNDELVQAKREFAKSKPKKISIGQV